MKIVSIIVTYNGAVWIEKCLLSIMLDSSLQNHIIVIDNGSTDSTKEIVEKFKNVEFIISEENLGFGQANNIGIKKALRIDADYVFLLNQDAWVDPNTISELIRLHKLNDEYGIISPIQLNGEGKFIDSDFFSYLRSTSYARKNFTNLIKNNNQQLCEVEFVNAAVWLISRSCLQKVGLFDKEFFHYGEDEDYVNRAIFHGFKIGYLNNVFAYHDRESILTKKVTTSKYKLKSVAISKSIFMNINHSMPTAFKSFMKVFFLRSFSNVFHFDFRFFIIDLFQIFRVPFLIFSIRKARKRNKKAFIS